MHKLQSVFVSVCMHSMTPYFILYLYCSDSASDTKEDETDSTGMDCSRVVCITLNSI